MDLFLHIGPHKTGTTAIQSAFADNTALLRRAGVFYPKCCWSYPAQHNLAFAMKGKRNPATGTTPDFDIELDSLIRALKKSKLPRAFVSSEEFFACPPDRIQALHDALPVASITVLAFPRRPDSFLISCHNQKIKQAGNGYSAPIQRFLAEPRKITPEIDYLACISAWADAFGDAQVKLSPFEQASPFDVVTRLLGVTDLTSGARNKSVPGVVAEVMRLAKVQDMPPTKQRKLFAKASELFADAPPFSVSTKDRRHVIKTFEADNDELFARFAQPNPYRADALDLKEEEAQQNVTVHDLIKLISELL